MNILFFTTEYNHPLVPNSGGIGTFVKVISSELTKRNHNIHVLGFSNSDFFFNDNGIKIVFFKAYPSIYIYKILIKILKTIFSARIYYLINENIQRFYWAYKTLKYVNNNNIDIIEAYDYKGYFKYFNLIKTPVVIRCHGSLGVLKEYMGYNDVSKDLINIEKSAFKRFNNIIAVSEYSKLINKEWFKKSNISKVYNGVDVDFFYPSKHIKIIEKSIFYIGTLSKKKGLHKLALIFNEVVQKYPEATLHLIGKGEKYLNSLKKDVFCSKALDRLVYYGTVPHEKIPLLINKSHIVVFPTEGENFPFSFLEVMSMEKIVIASNIPVSTEIIESGVNGFVAKSNKDYFDYISQIFEHKLDVIKIGVLARQTIIEKFSLNNMVQDTLEVYKKIIQNIDHE